MSQTKLKKGFAAMDEETKRRVQSLGGKHSPTKFKKGDGRAAIAGRKGGLVRKNVQA